MGDRRDEECFAREFCKNHEEVGYLRDSGAIRISYMPSPEIITTIGFHGHVSLPSKHIDLSNTPYSDSSTESVDGDTPTDTSFRMKEEEADDEEKEGHNDGGHNDSEESSNGHHMDAQIRQSMETEGEGARGREGWPTSKSTEISRRRHSQCSRARSLLSPRRTSKEQAAHSRYERMRRQRISRNIRTLQQLVPSAHENDDKASLLDKAIVYIKELQVAVQQCQMLMITNMQQHHLAGVTSNSIMQPLGMVRLNMTGTSRMTRGTSLYAFNPMLASPHQQMLNLNLQAVGGMLAAEFFPPPLTFRPVPGHGVQPHLESASPSQYHPFIAPNWL